MRIPALMLLAAAIGTGAVTGVPEARAQEYTLAMCIERVLAENPVYARARRDLQRSEVNVQQASSALLPTVGLTGAFSRYTSVSPQRLLNPATNQIVEGSSTAHTSHTYYSGLSLSQPLYNRSIAALYEQAVAVRSASAAAGELQRQQLVLQVHRGYYAVLRADRNLEVAREDVAYHEELLESVRTLESLGSRSRVDVLRQETALAQSRQRLASAHTDRARSAAEMNHMMGIPPEADLMLLDELEWSERSDSYTEHLARALQGHPSLRQVALGEVSARAGLEAAAAGRYPAINLSGNYSWRGDSYTRIGDAFSRDYTWSVGVNLSLPIFDGLRTRYNLERARIEVAGARQEREAVERGVARDVHQALLDLEESRQMLETARGAVELAQETLRLSQELYLLGSVSLLELNASRLDLMNAQYQEVQALFNLKMASAALDFAAGSLR